MRLTIIHDAKGNIRHLIAYPAAGPAAFPATKPGELVTQVEIQEITENLDGQEIFERLSDLANDYLVEVDRNVKLMRKGHSKTKRTKK